MWYLRKSQLPQDYLSKQQRKALSDLKNMSDVAILPADKGRATVITNKDEYRSKLTQLIQSGTYRLVKKDPTKTQETKIGRILKNLEREGKIPTMLYNRLRPTGCRPPLLYGLPKIHKLGIPLRPIVSCIGSTSYNLSKFISKLISPLFGKTLILK